MILISLHMLGVHSVIFLRGLLRTCTSCTFPWHWYKLQIKGKSLNSIARRNKKGNNCVHSKGKKVPGNHFCKRSVKVTFWCVLMEIDYHANRAPKIMPLKIIMPNEVCGQGAYIYFRYGAQDSNIITIPLYPIYLQIKLLEQTYFQLWKCAYSFQFVHQIQTHSSYTNHDIILD